MASIPCSDRLLDRKGRPSQVQPGRSLIRSILAPSGTEHFRLPTNARICPSPFLLPIVLFWKSFFLSVCSGKSHRTRPSQGHPTLHTTNWCGRLDRHFSLRPCLAPQPTRLISFLCQRSATPFSPSESAPLTAIKGYWRYRFEIGTGTATTIGSGTGTRLGIDKNIRMWEEAEWNTILRKPWEESGFLILLDPGIIATNSSLSRSILQPHPHFDPLISDRPCFFRFGIPSLAVPSPPNS